MFVGLLVNYLDISSHGSAPKIEHGFSSGLLDPSIRKATKNVPTLPWYYSKKGSPFLLIRNRIYSSTVIY